MKSKIEIGVIALLVLINGIIYLYSIDREPDGYEFYAEKQALVVDHEYYVGEKIDSIHLIEAGFQDEDFGAIVFNNENRFLLSIENDYFTKIYHKGSQIIFYGDEIVYELEISAGNNTIKFIEFTDVIDSSFTEQAAEWRGSAVCASEYENMANENYAFKKCVSFVGYEGKKLVEDYEYFGLISSYMGV